MPLIVPYCRMIPQTFSWKLRRAEECLSSHVGKWYNLAVFSGVIQNPHGAEVLRQAGCENFLTMVFSSPSGIKRAPGDLNCPPICWTVYNYILYNYSNHHTSSEHGIEHKGFAQLRLQSHNLGGPLYRCIRCDAGLSHVQDGFLSIRICKNRRPNISGPPVFCGERSTIL